MNMVTGTIQRDSAAFARAAPQRLSLGLAYVVCVPLAAGVGAVREVYVAGVSYTALLWAAFLFGGVVLILSERAIHPENHALFPWRPWLLFAGYVWLSLAWCEQAGRGNVQEAAQISSPLLAGIVASMFVRTRADYNLLVRCFVLTLLVLVGFVAVALVGALGTEQEEGGPYCAVRPLALTAALCACVFFGQWRSHKVLPLLGWCVCVLLAAVTGSRMATAALLLVPVVHPLYRSHVWRLVVLVVLVAGALKVFYLSSVQERFFYSGSGSLVQLSQGDFRDSGRSEIWRAVREHAASQPVFGTGVGSSGKHLLSIWSNMSHPHNDYLRVGADLGILGLAIFLPLVAWQLVDLALGIRQSDGAARCAFAAAFLGFFVFLVAAVTDNPLIYHLWYMNPLFTLMGAAYGLRPRGGAGREGVWKEYRRQGELT